MSRTAVDRHQVVVVGAGLAGLIAARDLTRAGIDCVVLETAGRCGGRIETATWEGARIELGAHFLGGRFRRVAAVVDDLGLSDELCPYPWRPAMTYRTHDGRTAVDPRKPFGAFTGSLVRGRDLAGAAPYLPHLVAGMLRADGGDLTTLRHLDSPATARLLGNRLVSALSGPMFDVFFGYPHRTASFPALMANAVQLTHLDTLAGGMEQIVTKIATSLPDVRTEHTATSVAREGATIRIVAESAGGPVEFLADAAVLATPADVTAEIWLGGDPAVRAHLESIRYSRLNLAYLRTDTRTDPGAEMMPVEFAPGSASLRGFLVLDDWCEDGGLLVAGAGADSPAAAADDAELAEILTREVERARPELAGHTVAARTVRGPRFMPVFDPGSARRLHRFRQSISDGAIAIAGDHAAAPGLEGAVASGHRAAQQIQTFF